MATIAVNDIWQTRAVCAWPSQVGLNIRHWRCTSLTALSVTGQEFATAVDSAVAASYKSLLSAAATYNGIGAQRVHPLPRTAEEISTAGAGAGAVAGDILPTQVSGLIKVITGLAGRSGRGRIYVPFPGEASSNAAGSPLAAYLANLTTLATAYIAPLLVGGVGGTAFMQPCITNKAFTLVTDLTGFVIRASWATQRRRGNFGAANIPPF